MEKSPAGSMPNPASSSNCYSDLPQLERQVERGQLFLHDELSQSFARLQETEAFLHALIDLLLSKGIVQEQELQEAIIQVRQEQAQRGERAEPHLAIQQEQQVESSAPPMLVDCAARMHVCHAICCKLDFALTISEIESGNIKWDLGRPYAIRHEQDGYCTHNQRETGHCGIYAHRPAICREYSCANDPRIWSDFEKMELNTAWINEHLSLSEHIQGACMEQRPQTPLIQVTRRVEKG